MDFLADNALVRVLIDWLMARYEALDFEYKISTTFALGVLMSSY